ncbi:MAG: EAL domain-containing protein, partial [Lachnospiraceae bacterium]|nr:EAL domain-containing protein [Lachnospiraceae bacterium]
MGYQDNYLAFCAADKETGELIGALKDCLEAASDSLASTHLNFKPVSFPTTAAALEALESGEVDCVFPANFSAYDSEELRVAVTPSIMRTDIYAIVRQSEQYVFMGKPHITVAVNEGNTNYDAFLMEHFPDWQKIYYADTPVCLRAVYDGTADCILISNYRYNNISKLCKKYHLTTYDTGIGLDYSFAVAEGQNELYGILTKAISLVPPSHISSALSYYITEDAQTTFKDYLTDHMPAFLTIVSILLVLIVTLLIRSIRAEKRSKDLIHATEIDRLTGLYNRDYFFQYANRMYYGHPGIPMDAIVLNIEQFHSINALIGRDFGDQVLSLIGSEIRRIAEENGGIGGRFGADRFDIYCRHTYQYQNILDQIQEKLDQLAPNISIRLRMGVMPWQEKIEPVQQFDRARAACSLARGNFKEHLIVFDETLQYRELREQRLLNDLRHALAVFEFDVYYQPKYDIQTEPPTLVSAEALVRWQHPELGLIPPDQFIPLFEKNGKIGKVDQYVWSQAARQVVSWHTQFGITLPISVNLSRVDLFDPNLLDILDNIVTENGLEPYMLKLEVTESAYIENADQLFRVVTALHEKGYTIEMDDF